MAYHMRQSQNKARLVAEYGAWSPYGPHAGLKWPEEKEGWVSGREKGEWRAVPVVGGGGRGRGRRREGSQGGRWGDGEG